MNLVLIHRGEFDARGRVELTDRRAAHLVKVKKVKPGEVVPVGEINGAKGTGEVVAAEENKVVLDVALSDTRAEACTPVDVILALPRPQILKASLQVSSMMGVRRLYIVRSIKSEKSYLQSRVLEPKQLEYYLTLGLEQGMNTVLPEVIIVPKFYELFSHFGELTRSNQTRLLAHPGARRSLLDVFRDEPAPEPQGEYLLGIGPEGGWVENECSVFERAGFKTFRLGHHVLRVEYALTALLAHVAMLGELTSSAKVASASHVRA